MLSSGRHFASWCATVPDALADVIAEATRTGVKVLGLESYLIGEDAVYPDLSRIADFSHDPSDVAAQKATRVAERRMVRAARKLPDQMHSEASGRHMMAVVLAG